MLRRASPSCPQWRATRRWRRRPGGAPAHGSSGRDAPARREGPAARGAEGGEPCAAPGRQRLRRRRCDCGCGCEWGPNQAVGGQPSRTGACPLGAVCCPAVVVLLARRCMRGSLATLRFLPRHRGAAPAPAASRSERLQCHRQPSHRQPSHRLPSRPCTAAPGPTPGPRGRAGGHPPDGARHHHQQPAARPGRGRRLAAG